MEAFEQSVAVALAAEGFVVSSNVSPPVLVALEVLAAAGVLDLAKPAGGLPPECLDDLGAADDTDDDDDDV